MGKFLVVATLRCNIRGSRGRLLDHLEPFGEPRGPTWQQRLFSMSTRRHWRMKNRCHGLVTGLFCFGGMREPKSRFEEVDGTGFEPVTPAV